MSITEITRTGKCCDRVVKRPDVVPGNFPDGAFFEKNGFAYAGNADPELNIGNIPVFSVYELNRQQQ